MLSFGAESFVFQFAIQKFKDQDNFSCCFVWVSNLVATLREERRLRVFENRVLIFGPKRDEVTGEWRKLHNLERNYLYFSPNIVRVIKSRRMEWAGHVACMGESRGVYRVLMGKPEGKNHLEDPGVDARIILRWIFRKCDGGMDWIDLAQIRDRWRALVKALMNLRVP